MSRKDKAVCRAMESNVNEISADPEIMDWVGDAAGPDAFLLRASGGRRWAAEVGVFDGDCEYRFDVAVSNGGSVWLEIWHAYTVSTALEPARTCAYASLTAQDYMAFDERHERHWPRKLMHPLFEESVELRLCPAECPVYHAGRLDATTSGDTAVSPQSAWQSPSLACVPQNLPKYGGKKDLVGLYLP